MNQGASGWRVLGKIHIYSINQSGQGLRLCSPENTFVLSQKPSIFHLLVMTSSSMKFDWDGTTSAVPVSHGHVPDYSVDLEFHKCVFDHVGSSFKSRVLEDGWMRHENSRVYFHHASSGNTFDQDASFVLIPYANLSSRHLNCHLESKRSLASAEKDAAE